VQVSRKREHEVLMAKDLGDAACVVLGKAAREMAQTVLSHAHRASKNGPLSDDKGVTAGVGLAALAPRSR
jgi:hypothetical protein